MEQHSAIAAPAVDDDEIDLGLLWGALRARAWLILWLTMAGATIGVASVLLARPLFQAEASLYLGDVNNQSGGAGAAAAQGLGADTLFGGLLGLGGSGVETQVQILKSRDLVVSAITASGLNAHVWQGSSESPPVVRWWRWRLLDGKRFTDWAPGPHTLIVRNSDVSDPTLSDVPLTLRFGAGGAFQVLNNGSDVLKGHLGEPAAGAGLRFLLKAAHSGFTPRAGSEYRLRIKRAVRVYRDLFKEGLYGVSTTSGGAMSRQPTLVVALSYKEHNPYRAQRFLARLIDSYLAQNLRWSTDQAAAAYGYLDGQLKKIRASLQRADRRLADYKKSSGVVAVSANAKAMIEQLGQYQTQRSAAKLKLYNLRQIAHSIDGNDPSIDNYLLSAMDDQVLDTLSGELAAAETKLATLTPGETERAPEVVQLRARIARIEKSIRNLIGNQKDQAETQVHAMDRLINQFEVQLKQLPEAELKLASLTRSSEVLGKLYMFLLQQQQQAAISKAGAVSNNRILDQAETARRPVSPVARTHAFLGLFLGLFVGVSWSIFRALFTTGFRSEDELRRAHPSFDWYALLPHFHRRGRKAAAFAPADPRSDFGEAIRTLRGNVYLSQRAGQDRTWMITSAMPGDGKSTVAYELAVALAHDGKRVVLVDADIRKPHAHEQFNVAQAPGLCDVLAGRAKIAEAIRIVEQYGFELLPAGPVPPNPAELIGSAVLPAVIEELSAQYQFVLIDTPPYPRIGDAPLIARHVERILSVVRIGRTPRNAYAAHLRGLAVEGRTVGLVVNDLGGAQGGYGYGYGYGHGHDEWAKAPRPRWRRWLIRKGEQR